jgi:thiol-disulfide isomerase/thioredoxin
MRRILHWQSGFLLGIAVVLSFGMSLQAQPTNDMFANRITITGTNTVVTGSNVSATSEPGEPYHADETGGASVWWSWTAPSAGTVTISTAFSTFDTLLAVYTGSSVSNLTPIASDDDDPDSYALTSKVIFDAVPGQTYQIAVDGYRGDSGNVALSLQLGPSVPPPPAIPAPLWSLPSPSGVMDSSTNYNGKVVILNFWATWCVPCKAEMPDLVALQEKYGADGLVIIGADIAETTDVVSSFLSTWTPTVDYPVVMADAAMANAYGGIPYIPTTFIIDRHNLIRNNYVGTQLGSTFERQIIPLLYEGTRLACERNGNQLTLSWPSNAANFILESTPDLNGSAWSAWPDAPTVINGSNTVMAPITDSPAYFRLRLLY